jgi:hypothetical protein
MLRMLNRIADFLAHHRGLPTLIGIGLILINLALQFFPTLGWLRESNLLLHLGIVLGLAGILVANAL